MSEYEGNFTAGVKSPADSKYNVRMDVLDPQTRQPLNCCRQAVVGKSIDH